MPQIMERNQVWGAFWTLVWKDAGGSKDLNFDVNPHEAPCPVECSIRMKGSPFALGVVEFEPGEHGRLLRCTCVDTERTFAEFPKFVRYLQEVAAERAALAEGFDHLESEPELWGNLDH